MTAPEFYHRRKTVTRRLGWSDVKIGELLCGIEKGQGLRPGQTVVRLAVIVVTSATREPLNSICIEDVTREGFPGMSPDDFCQMFRRSHPSIKSLSDPVTRIEFLFVPGSTFDLPQEIDYIRSVK